MKLAMALNYSGDFHADVTRVQDLEKAGLDVVWVAEAYSYDAISQVGYLAAKTERIEIGTGIINVFSRTATAVAQTGAGGVLMIAVLDLETGTARVIGRARDWIGDATCTFGRRYLGCTGPGGVRIWRKPNGTDSD